VTERSEQGMRSYWDEAARQNAMWYVDTSLSFEHPDMDRFLETGRTIVSDALEGAPVTPPGRDLAVEIGSGLGRICAALAERFDRVIGIDISPEMIRRAGELTPDSRISYRLGSGSSLEGVEDAIADLVLSFTVFQHIPRAQIVERYIAEAGRILKPGGVFVFQWNNTPGVYRWAARRALLSFLQRTGLRAERHRRHAPQFLGCRVPLARIERALAAGGLELRGAKGLDTLYAWAWAVRT
jgi:SAM-dependent methyltransferase